MVRALNLSKGLLIAFVLLIVSCKSVPTGTVVKAPDLLNNSKNFYISIPSAADPELIKFLIKNNIQNISDSDVDEIVSRIDRAYAGLNADNKNPRLQLAIDSNIPVKYIPKILNKKNGWEVSEFIYPLRFINYEGGAWRVFITAATVYPEDQPNAMLLGFESEGGAEWYVYEGIGQADGSILMELDDEWLDKVSDGRPVCLFMVSSNWMF